MKKFLFRTCWYIFPLMAVSFTSEWLLRRIPNDYSFKAAYYSKHGGEIETLILGNSHGFYDLDPKYFSTRTFNGAHVAQTIDMDAAIFDLYGPLLTRLKCLILPLSDVSFYTRIYHSRDDWRVKNYTLYYGIKSPFRLSDYSETLSLPFSINRNRLERYYLQHISPVVSSDLGFGTDYISAKDKDLGLTAASSTAHHVAGNSADMPRELSALNQIISACTRRQITLFLIVPPFSKEYYSTMPPGQIDKTISICDSLQKVSRFVRFLNFRKDSGFRSDEFFDSDHLNEKGAAHFSTLMDSVLRN